MKDSSPFMPDRFEYEQAHLYFLKWKLFRNLEKPKPIYLIGSRGTGKTTLLKALDWRERLHSSSLRSQIEGDPFQSKFLGIYLKLPEIQLGMIEEWVRSEERERKAEVLSLYLDLLILEELLDGIASLITEHKIEVAPTSEIGFAKWLWSQFPRTFQLEKEISSPTFRGCIKSFRSVRRKIEDAARYRKNIGSVCSEIDMIGQIGELGRNVTKRLHDLPGMARYFKVSMDEGECLSDFQQLVINSMVRLSKYPLFYVISYVSIPADTVTTLLPNLTLQQADREILTLDTMDLKEFKELSEGVVAIRIENQLKSSWAFSMERVLGRLNLNRMLESILKGSVDSNAKMLLKEAVEQTPRKRAAKSPAPPIYQTYLARELGILDERGKSKTAWERRKQESAEMRKRMVVAYLSICRTINAVPRYESSEMVLQMSDMCVRDLLSQFHHLFLEANISLRKFIQTRLKSDTQHKGLKKASEIKRDSIPESGVGAPRETVSLVQGLAKLTTMIQNQSTNGQHLRSSEMGIYRVDRASRKLPHARQVIRIIEEAAEAGFLRILDSDNGDMEFRVHKSLAASFGFSYRGAYYKCPLGFKEVESLKSSGTDQELDKAVSKIANRIWGITEGEPSLFMDSPDEIS